MPRAEIIDHTGQSFGYLTVLRREGSTRKYAAWRCACSCGQEVVVSGYSLRKGFKKACCIKGHKWRSDYFDKNPGLSRMHHSEYRSFSHMHARCYHKKNDRYKDYGGRGIKVCERWHEFKNFITDLGSKPAPEYTIERIDNDGNYEPGNCCWATREEQRRNMRSSVYVNYEGKRVLLLELTQQMKLSRQIVHNRLKLGWSLEDALTVPVRAKKKNRRKD